MLSQAGYFLKSSPHLDGRHENERRRQLGRIREIAPDDDEICLSRLIVSQAQAFLLVSLQGTST